MKKEIFKADHEEKVIEIYQKDFEKLTPEEERTIVRYKNLLDYKIKILDNPERQPRKSKSNSLKEADILAALVDDEAAKEKYNQIKSEKGFLAARTWFLQNHKTDR